MPKKSAIGKKINKILKQNQRAIKVSSARVVGGIMRGDNEILQREIQSRVDRAVAKKSGGKTTGRGAYGRGQYGYGRGAYAQAPVAVNSLFKEFSGLRGTTRRLTDETGRVEVEKREYVMRVVVPSNPAEFSVTSLSVNPGLSGVFAWLSQIAANYDEYELIRCIFHYKPVISVASQSGAMGSIVIACNYNAGAPKFESFREMVEYEGAMETRICDPALFGIECDPKKGVSGSHMFVRTGSVPMDEDIKTYDTGLFQIATSDVNASDYPAGTLLGHLYVEYKVVLGKPKLYASLGKSIIGDMHRCPLCTRPAAMGVNAANVYSNNANSLGGTYSIVNTTTLRYTLPDNFVGTVRYTFYCVGTDLTPGPDMEPTFGYGGQLLIKPTQMPDGSQNFEIVTDPGSLMFKCSFDIRESLVAGGNYIQWDFGGVTTLTSWASTITMVSPDFDNGWSN